MPNKDFISLLRQVPIVDQEFEKLAISLPFSSIAQGISRAGTALGSKALGGIKGIAMAGPRLAWRHKGWTIGTGLMGAMGASQVYSAYKNNMSKMPQPRGDLNAINY